MKLKPPELRWLDSDIPFSIEYNDRYFSEDNLIEECKHVFLDANDLPDRWITSADKKFVIAEIGFGFGLNFALTLELYDKHNIETQLHYIAFEKHPPTREQINRFYSKIPKLKTFCDVLCRVASPIVAGCHRVQFSKNVILDLHLGDVQDSILNFQLDKSKISAWFIDGFAPKKNERMWCSLLCDEISRLSDFGTTLSSYSAAGSFRRKLEGSKFEVQKSPGYGRKRHMTRARMTAGDQPNRKHKSGHDFSVAIIGAGIAGCATAYSLAKRDIPVKLFESQRLKESEKSRISYLALRPRLFNSISCEAEFFLQSYLYAVKQLDFSTHKSDIGWNKTGVIQLDGALNKQTKVNHEDYCAIYPESVLRSLTRAQVNKLSKLDLSAGGLYFPDGGFVDTAKLCKFYLTSNYITKHFNTSIQSIAHEDDTWILYSKTGNEIARAEAIVIANGHSLTQFDQIENLPTSKNYGYTNWFHKKHKDNELNIVICGEKTIFPSDFHHKNDHFVAATYEQSLSESSQAKATLENLMGANCAFSNKDFLIHKSTEIEVGTRCGTPDRRPYIGRVPNLTNIISELGILKKNAKANFTVSDDCFWPNLFINAGHGSNGLSTGSLGAELISSMINEEPIPASKQQSDLICPSRIIIRELKRQKI